MLSSRTTLWDVTYKHMCQTSAELLSDSATHLVLPGQHGSSVAFQLFRWSVICTQWVIPWHPMCMFSISMTDGGNQQINRCTYVPGIFFFFAVLDGRDGTSYLSSRARGLQRKGVTGLVVDLQPPSLNPRGTTQVTHSHSFRENDLAWEFGLYCNSPESTFRHLRNCFFRGLSLGPDFSRQERDISCKMHWH